MKTMDLGATGIPVSALCFGTMYFDTRTDESTSAQLLDRYVEAGGRFLDTANTYAHWVEGGYGGESERFLGRWMKDRGNRDDLFIATKVAFGYKGTAEDPGVESGLRAETIVSECEKSLRRMGIDTIDLYYAHHDDKSVPLEESLAAFDRLVKDGKVRCLGASNHWSWRLADALALCAGRGWAPFVCVQQKHSYLKPNEDRDFKFWPPATYDFLQLCREKSLSAIAYSPLLRGAYARDDRHPGTMYESAANRARMATLRTLAAEKGATSNQLVLAWMLHSDPPVIPLFSASTREQLDEDLGALDVTLNDAEMARLNSAGDVPG